MGRGESERNKLKNPYTAHNANTMNFDLQKKNTLRHVDEDGGDVEREWTCCFVRGGEASTVKWNVCNSLRYSLEDPLWAKLVLVGLISLTVLIKQHYVDDKTFSDISGLLLPSVGKFCLCLAQGT